MKETDNQSMISISGKGYSPCCAFENLICGSRYSIIIVIIIIVVVIVIVIIAVVVTVDIVDNINDGVQCY